MSERVEKSWGWEEILYNGLYCQKYLIYNRPIASSLHYHERKTESFYIADGIFEIEIGKDSQPVRATAGQWFHIPAGTVHRVRCLRNGTILEASTKDDPTDCIRLVPSET